MATTASGWSYAVPNDTLVAWPAVSQAVADKLETNIVNTKTGLAFLNKTTFSAAANVVVDSIFTSTYRNYKIVFNMTSTSTADLGITINWRSAGADQTAAQYVGSCYILRSNGTTAALTSNSGTTYYLPTATSNNSSFDITVFNPQIATNTIFSGTGFGYTASSFGGGHYNMTTQNDGFKITFGGSNSTGTVTVYGIRD